MGQRRFPLPSALIAGALLLAACAPTSPPAAGGVSGADPAARPPAASGPVVPADWDQLVAAARQEGVVVIAAPPGSEFRPALKDAFERAYPGIRVEVNAARSNEHWGRMQAERAAGRYLTDLLISGGVTTVLEMKPAGALAALKPQLVLPEVVDESLWLQNRLWWNDAQEPYTTLAFQGSSLLNVAYNSTLVDPATIPAEFTSYWDLLNPKWKGKMASTDIRDGLVGGVPSRWMYVNPDLGPTFLERLYSEMDIRLTADQRQLVDWLASGQYTLVLFLSPAPAVVAIDQGLPIRYVPAEQFKEGAAIGPNNGGVAMMQPAPHPNAAKLYVNWLLSRDGQMAWQRHVQGASLRTDIPRDGVFAPAVPQPGYQYVNASTEEYSRLTPTAIRELVTRALEKGRQ